MATESLPAPRRFDIPTSVIRIGRFVGALLAIALLPLVFGLRPSAFVNMLNPNILRFLGIGVIATLGASLISILLSLPLATFLALGRFSTGKPQRYLSTAIIEMVRAVPVLLFIFYVDSRFPGLSAIESLSLSGLAKTLFGSLLSAKGLAVIIALTVYTAVVNAELIRAGMLSLDRGQFEAARSLGMSYGQMMRFVVLPQTFRRVLPPLIAQFTTLVKDTSLGYVIGFIELQKSADIIRQQPQFNPMAVLYVVALIYFVINYALSKASIAVQQRSGGMAPPVELSA